MEKLEGEEGGRQILALHHKLRPDAISYITSTTLVTSRFCFVLFSRRTVFYLSIFTFMHSERKSAQWKMDSLHYLFFPILHSSAPLWPPRTRQNQIWAQLTKDVINTIVTKLKKRLWRNRSKKLIYFFWISANPNEKNSIFLLWLLSFSLTLYKNFN